MPKDFESGLMLRRPHHEENKTWCHIISTLISWTIIIKDYCLIAVIMLTPHNGEIDPLEVHVADVIM